MDDLGSSGVAEFVDDSVGDNSVDVVFVGMEAGEARCMERRPGPAVSSDRMTVMGMYGL